MFIAYWQQIGSSVRIVLKIRWLPSAYRVVSMECYYLQEKLLLLLIYIDSLLLCCIIY